MGLNGLIVWALLLAAVAVGYVFAKLGDSGGDSHEQPQAPPATVRRDPDGQK
jgi:hypothetical protein